MAHVDLTEHGTGRPSHRRPAGGTGQGRPRPAHDPRLGGGHRGGDPRAHVRLPRARRDLVGPRRCVLRDGTEPDRRGARSSWAGSCACCRDHVRRRVRRARAPRISRDPAARDRDDGVRRGAAPLPPRARRGQGPVGIPRAELPPRRTARRRLRARWDRRPARPREAGRLDRARCGRRRPRAHRRPVPHVLHAARRQALGAGDARRAPPELPARAGSACSTGSTGRSAGT